MAYPFLVTLRGMRRFSVVLRACPRLDRGCALLRASKDAATLLTITGE
jgi:hypothetical protein